MIGNTLFKSRRVIYDILIHNKAIFNDSTVIYNKQFLIFPGFIPHDFSIKNSALKSFVGRIVLRSVIVINDVYT